ncbi:XRE family transcriptional regulator [Fictibacillus nanhaiensis]|uniref:helix-turn-helix transcriptional regulator n=1 Tax=Fictibacillus nanhaiensis TaxID=742169 RepID=UPI002040B556|nr:helix-turn-helix domain-containing protein [Fictibacillus nanhaiensis]MCM3732362.1 XRE family transcriptional regulator [Fictibacillus nanhaiensis]
MNAKLVKMLRRLNSLSQHEAADKLGVSRALIALVETEKAPVSRSLELKIKDTFGLRQIEHVKATMRVFHGGENDEKND